jgi:predicted GIY-YIG superfamily endonuclease
MLIDREYIVYVKQLKSRKMVVEVSNGNGLSPKAQTDAKIVYYEVKTNAKTATAREKKLKSLNRTRLQELVRGSNPDMLDLRTTLNSGIINETNF